LLLTRLRGGAIDLDCGEGGFVMRRFIPFVIVLSCLFCSCTTTPTGSEQTAGARSTPSMTIISSVTPTPTPIPADTATATPEPQYSMPSSPGDFVNHTLDYEKDIASGKLQEWLNTQSVPFDTSKIITNVPLIAYFGYLNEIIYGQITTGFSADTAPYRKHILGHIVYEGVDHVVFGYELFDITNPRNKWILTEVNIVEGENIPGELQTWGNMNNLAINVTDITRQGTVDQLAASTFTMYPDMNDRIKHFVNQNYYKPGVNNPNFQPGGDLSALGAPGIILLQDVYFKE